VTSKAPLWRMWLTEEAVVTLLGAAERAHPRETGGVLVGVHTHGARPWVAHAVELPSPKATGAFYEVPAGSRRTAVKKLRRQDSRLGYLGEWHVHPADVPPSPTDTATIERLAEDRSAGCDRPVLLVVRKVNGGYALDARQLSRGALRELQIIATGTLQQPDSSTMKPKRRLRAGRRIYLRSR
jgi:proteasome lid subunit RPN8/RPN11